MPDCDSGWGRLCASWVAAGLVLALIGCGDDTAEQVGEVTEPDAGGGDAASSEGDAGSTEPDAGQASDVGADLEELLELGIDEYIGAAPPIGSEMLSGVDGIADGSIVYDFDPEDGPMCLFGEPFHMSLLDQGSDNLMIFMQGGGACLSLVCSATSEPRWRGVPQNGILDIDDPDSPVADWNIVYVPYCDGSVFSGDNDFEEEDRTRFHRGQRNFSAALDRALEHFPNPRRVLLAGSSAGGWGTVYQRALVRSQYPSAELTVMNDAGVGLATNQNLVAEEWGSATRYRPPSCEACQTHAHMTHFVKYYMEHDPEVVVGDFTSWRDSVVMRFTFLTDPDEFAELLGEETAITADAFPDRYKRFIIEGSSHTALQTAPHSTQIDGVSVSEWLQLMIERDPEWVELIE